MSEAAPNPPLPPAPPDGWELACAGILRTQFGRRPSRALTKAMTQLAAEEAADAAWTDAQTEVLPGWFKRLRQWYASLRHAPLWALGAALVLVLGGAAWFWRSLVSHDSRTWRADSVCAVYDMVNVQLAGRARPLKIGDVLPAGPLRLESGVLELEFVREVKVAIEGPADLELTNPQSLSLKNGKLAAHVPRSGVGFTVTTPTATIVDLGTQFGVSAAGETCAVAVFDGRVQVTASSSGRINTLTPNLAARVDADGNIGPTTLSAAAFPQIGRAITINPENCDFDTLAELKPGGLPIAFGYWSGPACAISGSYGGVNPLDGQGMLRFHAAATGPGGAPALPAKSETWQLLDLRPFQRLLEEGGSGKLSAQFNRVGGPPSADRFGLTLAAFRGRPEAAANLWQRRSEDALALVEGEIVTDTDPVTWELLEVTASLPPGTDFLIVELRAIGPAAEAGVVSPFPGHFADRVSFKLRVPLRASSL